MALGRKTGGRTRGTPNKASTARQEAVSNSGLTPLDFMLNLLRTEPLPVDPKLSLTENAKRLATSNEMRFEAAKAAAPYIHPKLANVDIGNRGDKPFQVTSVETDKKLL